MSKYEPAYIKFMRDHQNLISKLTELSTNQELNNRVDELNKYMLPIQIQFDEINRKLEYLHQYPNNPSSVNVIENAKKACLAIYQLAESLSGELINVAELGGNIALGKNTLSTILDSYNIASYSYLTLFKIPLDSYGNRIHIDSVSKQILHDSFQMHSMTYKELMNSLSGLSLYKINLIRPARSSIEFFNSIKIIETITGLPKATESTELDETSLKNKIQEHNDSVNFLLEEFEPKLLQSWDGACAAANSDNPDRTRHVTVSLRELFTLILHKLAPDDKIKNWNNDPKLYSKNRPTRKARLLYICKDISHPPFSDFIEKDIESTLQFLDLFQQGTHQIDSDFSSEQLTALVKKSGSLISYLLIIGKQYS